jgi:hypothetical protein
MKSRAIVTGMMCGALLAACSKQEGPSIVGHWKAERATVFSAQLPVGPDIVISEQAIRVPGTDGIIALSGITKKSGEAVLEMPYGVGLSFYFDGADRVHLNVPLLGKIYYRRVLDAAPTQVAVTGAVPTVPAPPPAIAVPPASSAPQRPAPAAQSANVIDVAATTDAAPNVATSTSTSPEFDHAVLAARQGDQDLAIDRLRDAFQHGFKNIDELDATPEFAALRSDVRFQALVARYR